MGPPLAGRKGVEGAEDLGCHDECDVLAMTVSTRTSPVTYHAYFAVMTERCEVKRYLWIDGYVQKGSGLAIVLANCKSLRQAQSPVSDSQSATLVCSRKLLECSDHQRSWSGRPTEKRSAPVRPS